MDFILQYSVFCTHVIMCGVYGVVWDTTQFLECIMRMVHSRKNESNFDLGDESRQLARTNLCEPVQTDGSQCGDPYDFKQSNIGAAQRQSDAKMLDYETGFGIFCVTWHKN